MGTRGNGRRTSSSSSHFERRSAIVPTRDNGELAFTLRRFIHGQSYEHSIRGESFRFESIVSPFLGETARNVRQ